MSIQIRARGIHLKALFREGVWGKWIAMAWGFISFVSLVKTEGLTPKQQDDWQFVHVIPAIPLGFREVATVLVIAFWVFEASFKRHLTQETVIGSLSKKMDEISEERALAFIEAKIFISKTSNSGPNYYVSPTLTMLTLTFKNTSDRDIKFDIKDLSINCPGTLVTIGDAATTNCLIHGHEQNNYNFPLRATGRVDLPLESIIGFKAKFDNEPPLKKRYLKRVVKHIFQQFDPITEYSVVLEQKDS